MKRKQVVLDKLDSLDNSLIAIWQALQVPGVTKEVLERYLRQIRHTSNEITDFIKLED